MPVPMQVHRSPDQTNRCSARPALRPEGWQALRPASPERPLAVPCWTDQTGHCSQSPWPALPESSAQTDRCFVAVLLAVEFAAVLPVVEFAAVLPGPAVSLPVVAGQLVWGRPIYSEPAWVPQDGLPSRGLAQAALVGLQ